jgi:hypothetical protein
LWPGVDEAALVRSSDEEVTRGVGAMKAREAAASADDEVTRRASALDIWEVATPGDSKVACGVEALEIWEACEACVFDISEVSVEFVSLAGEDLHGEPLSRSRRASLYIL